MVTKLEDEKKQKNQTVRRELQNHREQLACYAPDNCYSQKWAYCVQDNDKAEGQKGRGHVWMAKTQIPLQSHARSMSKVSLSGWASLKSL